MNYILIVRQKEIETRVIYKVNKSAVLKSVEHNQSWKPLPTAESLFTTGRFAGAAFNWWIMMLLSSFKLGKLKKKILTEYLKKAFKSN